MEKQQNESLMQLLKFMTSKEILIVSNYFPPEKGAASNRIFTLAEGLEKKKLNITVVCPLPNYPKGKIFKEYKGQVFSKKNENNLLVYRLWNWPSISSHKFIRLFSMLSFSFSLTLFFLLKKTPNKIIIQYSPVFVGFTSVFWSWVLGKKIILNVSDLWPLAGFEMGLLKKGFYYNILTFMEHFCYKKAHLILGQSQEILDYITQQNIKTPLFLYRNYPDFKPPLLKEKKSSEKIKIVYAGLLGVAQGIFDICSAITFPKNVELHLFGNGPETEKIKTLNKTNIFYHGELDRSQLHQELLNYDIGFVPLTNRIYGSVPSKIFELSRLGLPILYFAGGEGEDLVRSYKLGWIIPVNNLHSLQQFIDNLNFKKLDEYSTKQVQKKAIQSFNLTKQFGLFVEKIKAL